ncbi:MAG TPA: hypothetical protein DCE44_14590, partial [Verrucomicrobiales bacterium]|nr:hypothetical protein [Verrucomicrobiales bacterium]
MDNEVSSVFLVGEDSKMGRLNDKKRLGSSGYLKGAVLLLVASTFLSEAVGVTADLPQLPPAALRSVDFIRDIQPIFAAHCVECHGSLKQKGGFRLDEREAALKGGENHAPDIRPNKSEESPLIHLVAGLVPDLRMPQKGDPLAAEQIGLLRAWIDQGAHWPADLQTPKPIHWALKPVERPTVPPAGRNKTIAANPIDAFVA